MTAPQEQRGMQALEAYIAYRTLKHSADQDAVAAALALGLYPLWAIQQFSELDRSTPLWISAALPYVKTAFLQSQRLTAVYASDIRYASLADADPLPMKVPDVQKPDGLPEIRFSKAFIPEFAPSNVIDLADFQEPVVFDEFPMSDVATSLAINGNYEIKANMPGPERDLMYSGLSNSSGAAIRQAINGSRGATGRIVEMDRKIRGYARVTDGNPCWFCAILASRGAVFKKGSFNTGGRTSPWNGALTKADKDFAAAKDAPDLPEGYTNVAKVHNHCRCTLRPVYWNEKSYGGEFDAHRDEEAQFYFDQWEKVSRDNYWLDNKQQLEIFREQYQPFVRKSADISDIRTELQQRLNALQAAGATPVHPQMQWAQAQLTQLA